MGSTIETEVAERLECSAMASAEMLKPAKVLAQHFAAVYDTFDLEYLIVVARTILREFVHSDIPSTRATAEIQRKIEEWELHTKKVRRSLPSPVARLLVSYELAVKQDDLFRKAFLVAELRPDRSASETLTIVLSVLHTHGHLKFPEKVAEGRLACMSIRRAGIYELGLPQGHF